MLEALGRFFPAEASWSHPEGGLFVWATLPDYINTTDLLARALRENVAFVPGQAAFVDGRGSSSMRLNFSAQTEEEITEGIRRIGRVISEQVELYRTITGEHRVPPPAPAPRTPRRPVSRRPGARCCRCDRAGSARHGRRRRDARRRHQGRSLARARRLAALRGQRRGRARRPRARGHPARRGRRPGRRPEGGASRRSRSSPCTGPAARTAPSRSCSRSSGSPTPGRASPPACARSTR